MTTNKRTTKTTTATTERTCGCGCGEATRGGQFLPGHDAKLKGLLKAAAKQGDLDAEQELIRRGWDIESMRARKEAKRNAPPKEKVERPTKPQRRAELLSADAINAEYKATCARLADELGPLWHHSPGASEAIELLRARFVVAYNPDEDAPTVLRRYAVRQSIVEQLVAA